ncbi:MAG: D-glycerate dehydrogenase, partial [Rhodospirillales bacterium]|nr:D-glycerate dehydrogenase [Rhodospirillales bacterium]
LALTRRLPAPVMTIVARDFVAWFNDEDRTLSSDELVRAAADHRADVLLVMAMDRVDADVIARLPASVRVIATFSVGHEHIDLAAARARGIAVLSTPDVLSDAVADMAMLLLLAAARRAREGEALIYQRRWTGWSPTQLIGRDVTGGRLGILGMGRIGRAVARRAHHGFAMQIHYHNRNRLDAGLEDGATFHSGLETFLAASDFLVLAAPASAQTQAILNTRTIAALPDGAVIVNISRGGLIEDAALIDALRRGKLSAAGLDVFNNEPEIDPGYLTLPNVFLQPHQGSSTIETRVRMGEVLLDSIHRAASGQSVANRLV